MIILGMIIRSANAVALSSRAATGVMPLEASCALDGFWLICDYKRYCFDAKYS